MLETIDIADLETAPPEAGQRAIAALERGAVVLLARQLFTLCNPEQHLILTDISGSAAKNISFDPTTNTLKHTTLNGPPRETLTTLLARYAAFTQTLLHAIAPAYIPGLTLGRTSFRPASIAARETSWRKDDRRRHVDAFPSTPTGGARILRVFTNADPHGTPRCWKIGPDFETYATTFLPRTTWPPPGTATLLASLGITKSRRTGYDQLMLGLHDAAKRDTTWQQTAPAQTIAFIPGQTWLAFTDQLPHAATSGQNALEQSFYLDPKTLHSPNNSPLAILTRLTQRDLAKPLV